MGSEAESKRRGARPGLHGKTCGRLPPPTQEPAPFLHEGCSPGGQASRAPVPGGLIWRTRSRRPSCRPRSGTRGAAAGGRMSAGPGTAPVCLSPRAALGDGCWHPPAFNTADPGWRKQRPGPSLAWPGPRGQFPQNSFPHEDGSRPGPACRGGGPQPCLLQHWGSSAKKTPRSGGASEGTAQP